MKLENCPALGKSPSGVASVLFLDGSASEARQRSPSPVASGGDAPSFSSGSIWAMTGRQPEVTEHRCDKAVTQARDLPRIARTERSQITFLKGSQSFSAPATY
jgi:hypothetical protein